MLTSDLLRVKIRGPQILPEYIAADDAQLLGLAASLIDIFRRHQGQSRGALQDELKEFLGAGTTFLLHRGLAKLLLDRSEFDTESPLDPEELRATLFATAAQAYQQSADGLLPREQVLQEVQALLHLAPAEVERLMYADLKDEQVLQTFDEVTPDWLLQRYNVALAQAVLFKATKLEIHIAQQPAARYRAVFQKIKFFQLLHEVHGSAEEGYLITLDGPLSLFKSSQKYGLQMASFLPTLLHCTDWTLEAEVLWGKARHRKQFQLSPATGLQPYTTLTGQWQPEEMQILRIQFPKLNTAWQLLDEPELLDLGGLGMLVPDYTFLHPPSGKKAYLEVFGFWRRTALQRRLELLKQHGPQNLILGVSRELMIEDEDLAMLPVEVYTFRTTPLASEILKLLDEMLGK